MACTLASAAPVVDGVRVYDDDVVRFVALSRAARRNAVDGATARRLHAVFTAFERDERVRVAVLYGEHGTFCAGADLTQVARVAADGGDDPLRSPANPLVPLDADGGRGGNVDVDDAQLLAPMGPTRLSLSKPVVAAVCGHAVAGGLELALWCDLRVAASTATFGVFCRRFGVPLIDGGSVRLSRAVGSSRALDLILTGRALPAREAHAWGLVNRLVDCDDVDADPDPDECTRRVVDAAAALARLVASHPQQCARSDRRSALDALWAPSERAALAREFQLGLPAVRAEAVGGARRFVAGAGRHGTDAAANNVHNANNAKL